MEKNRLRHLLEQQLADKATASEIQELSALLQNDANADLYKTVMAEMMQQQTPLSPRDEFAWHKMAEDIVRVDKVEGATVIRRRSFNIYRWAAAAAIILMLGTAT